jgi:hypothetical protein
MGVRTGWVDRLDGWQGTWILLTCRQNLLTSLWIVESLFTTSFAYQCFCPYRMRPIKLTQASKKMSMNSPWKIQDKTAGSCTTVQTGLWRRSNAPQCPADNDEDVRMLGQSVFNNELDFRSQHCLGSLCKPSGWCPVFQNIPEFHSNTERILAKTVWTLDQAVRTWTW